jgi:nitronate monooxygenase
LLTADRLARFRDRLSLPLIAAPMFLISGIELVTAACRNGVIGAFPTVNCRSPEELDRWLADIEGALQRHSDEQGKPFAPVCPNLIVHRSNARLNEDLNVLLRYGSEIVITSVGSPAAVIEPLHDAGALVLADVASIRPAERAVEAGANGLVLLTAGAGGQTGWLNPFAFVRAVRAFFEDPIVLAGGVSDGQALRAAEVLGCDLAYMGTKFIATRESMADARYKAMLVESSADDILLTTAFTGLKTNMLIPSIVAAGLDPDDLPARGAIDIGKDIDVGAREARPRRWRDIWSAGHSTSGVADVPAVAELIARTQAEYRAADVRIARANSIGPGTRLNAPLTLPSQHPLISQSCGRVAARGRITGEGRWISRRFLRRLRQHWRRSGSGSPMRCSGIRCAATCSSTSSRRRAPRGAATGRSA